MASLITLILHRLLEIEQSGDAQVGGVMLLVEAAMVVLSFPTGPVAMLFLLIFVESVGGIRDSSWLLDWPTLLFAGYLQWFWLLPEIRENCKPLTLNLTQRGTIAAPEKSSSVPEVTLAAPDAEAFSFPLTGFDEAGFTALERVLRK
ncbi:MAG: hypothetical protein ACR2G4_01560 [Pyrinomonadaceae bacterium]